MEDPWTNDWDLFAVRKIDTVCRHHSRRTFYPQRVREKFKARFAKENDLAPTNIPERRMKTGTNAVRVDCTVNRAFVTGRIQSEILYRVSRFPLSHALPSFVLRQLGPYGVLPKVYCQVFKVRISDIHSVLQNRCLTLELFYRSAYTLKAFEQLALESVGEISFCSLVEGDEELGAVFPGSSIRISNKS